MSFFFHNEDRPFCAAIVDIGSASVGIGLIISEPNTAQPRIIWSHREFSLIRDIDAKSWSLKEIETALVNAFLKLSTDGLKTLPDSATEIKYVTKLFVTISAPWAYTITKTINYSEPQPFVISESLLHELTAAAHRKALESVVTERMVAEAGIETIETETIGIIANGYRLTSYEDVKTRELCLYELSAHTHHRLIESIEEVQQKILPRAELYIRSFMAQFYEFMRESKPNTVDCCLIDITSEATEMGVVRDDLLLHTTNTAHGSFSLARNIATLTKVPKEMAYTYLRGGQAFIEEKLSKEKMKELQGIIANYDEEVAKLFKQTGDRLAIPKNIFLHCDADTEAFFVQRIKTVAKQVTGIDHVVHTISSEFVNQNISNGDTPILLTASEVHRRRTELID